MIKKYCKDIKNEFADYNASRLVKDLMAGLTVAAVALPLALAFGVSSGATAASGLITAIIAGCLIGILGGAFYQISGPTGAMAAILMGIIAQYGIQGVFIATAMAGIILIISGFLHLGRLTGFIPMPVITGFTSGIAVIIALGQVDNFFGVTSKGSSVIEKLGSYGHLGFKPDITTLLIGLLTILIMVVFPKKLNSIIPSSLFAIIVTTLIAVIFKLDISVVGSIPKTLLPDTRLNISSLNIRIITDMFAPAVSIAILGMIESLLCGASAGRMTGKPLDNDRELIAQGIGNLVVPFFGGIPATAAIARTSVAIKSGAKTRLTAVFHALGLLASMLLLSPVMSKIPLSALAGVLMVTAWKMNEWHTIKYMFKNRFKGAVLQFAVTMIATIVFDLTVAILVGVGVALILMVARFSKLSINFDDLDPERIDADNERLPEKALISYLTGPILFTNCSDLKQITDNIDDNPILCISMRGVPTMDISGCQEFLKIIKHLKEKDVSVYICGVQDDTMKMMKRSGIYTEAGESSFFWSVERALLAHNEL